MPKPLRDILTGTSWTSGMQQTTVQPQHYLRPGNYLAEIDDSPFLQDALRNAKKRKAHALVMGFGTHSAKGE